jgi:hypothetical protein
MMNKSLIIFSREWAVTASMRAYLSPVHFPLVTSAYDLATLIHLLREYPRTPVILGLSPHEHVEELYHLQRRLCCRVVLFVSRCFYWTDYSLPEWLGLKQYGFCSWDTMCDPFSRRREMRRFRHLVDVTNKDDSTLENSSRPAPGVSAITRMEILERANWWLYRELSAAGLNGFEVRVLSLMSEGLKGSLSSRTRSLYKNNGLLKLGMKKHVLNLYRGVKVRPELQAGLHCPDGESGRILKESGMDAVEFLHK